MLATKTTSVIFRTKRTRVLPAHKPPEDTGFAIIPLSVRMSQIKVPPLGESIVEATVSRWLKKEGESVA